MRKFLQKTSCVLVLGMALEACGSDDDSKLTSDGGSGGNAGTTTNASSGGSSGSPSGGSGGVASSAGGAAGSGDADCESPPLSNDLEIAGAYRDQWGSAHVVNDLGWGIDGGHFSVLEFSNDSGWVVAQNAADDPFNPGAYSRFEWTRQGDRLFYCQSVFDAEAAEAAKAAARADAGDLETGCGMFSWTELSPLVLVGSYSDPFGGSHEITPSLWQTGGAAFHQLEFSNTEGWLVALNDCNNEFSPGRYSRFEWRWSGVTASGGAGGESGLGAAGAGGAAGAMGAQAATGTPYYCQIGYDLETLDEALQLESADAADLATGCNGFAWTALTQP